MVKRQAVPTYLLGSLCDSFVVRLAKLLGIPAAVAIHNARLYEWAQIYAAERQTLLKKLDETEKIAGPPLGRFPN